MWDRRRTGFAIASITILFVVWAAVFVFRSSFVANDGRRYFCLFDDAMISLRYAWNLSHGHGLVWNPGERVEGITNLLMTLYMAIYTTMLSKSMAALAIQLSGIVFVVLVAYLVWLIAEQVLDESIGYSMRTLIRGLCFFCTLAYYPLTYWSLMGMEPGLLTVFLFFGLYRSLKNHGTTKPDYAVPLSLGLAFATRPDAAIPIALIVLYRLLPRLRTPAGRRIAWAELLILSGFVVGLTVFRWFYYGDIVPNTYRLKVGGIPFASRLENGWAFTRQFLATIQVPLILTVLGVLFNHRGRAFLLFSLIIASVGYQIAVGGDAWLHWRMLTPAVPLLFILSIEELHQIARTFLSTRPLKDYLSRRSMIPSVWHNGAVVGIGALFMLIMTNGQFEKEMTFLNPAYTVKNNRDMVNTALALRELCHPTASVAVLWGGSIPYYSGLRAIDMMGKSDPYIASLSPDLSGAVGYYGMGSVPGHNKYDLNYSIVEARPTYVQTFEWGKQDLRSYAEVHYRRVNHMGVELWLLKDSKQVRWERIEG